MVVTGLQMPLPCEVAQSLRVRWAMWTALCQRPLKRRKDCNWRCPVIGAWSAEDIGAQPSASHHLLSTQQASYLSDVYLSTTLQCVSSSQGDRAFSMYLACSEM